MFDRHSLQAPDHLADVKRRIAGAPQVEKEMQVVNENTPAIKLLQGLDNPVLKPIHRVCLQFQGQEQVGHRRKLPEKLASGNLEAEPQGETFLLDERRR